MNKLKDDQIQKIQNYLEATSSEVATIFLLLMTTGMRPDELCKVTKGSLLSSLPESSVNITASKDSKDRLVKIPSPIAYRVRLMAEKLSKDDSCLVSLVCEAQDRQSVLRSLRRQWKRILSGIWGAKAPKVGMYCLRHNFARKVYHATNFNIVDTAMVMGHKSINSTMVYAREHKQVELNDMVATLWK